MNGQQEQTAYDEYWKRQKTLITGAYVNLAFVVLCVLVFAAEFFYGDLLYEHFALDSVIVAQGRERYRLLTSVFMHASIPHLFGNMIVLFFLGSGVEQTLGHVPYAVFFILCGFTGNVASVLWDELFPRHTVSIGASGAVFGVIGAVVSMFVMDRIRTGKRHGSFGPRLGMMVLYLLYSGFADSEVNNAAHIGGLAAGIAVSVIVIKLFNKRICLEDGRNEG